MPLATLAEHAARDDGHTLFLQEFLGEGFIVAATLREGIKGPTGGKSVEANLLEP